MSESQGGDEPADSFLPDTMEDIAILSQATGFTVKSVVLQDGHAVSLFSDARFSGEQINLKNKFPVNQSEDI